MIVNLDAGPHENPRYEKTINCSIKYFVENGLHVFFLATNAPDRSALNSEKNWVVLSSNMINLGVTLMRRV